MRRLILITALLMIPVIACAAGLSGLLGTNEPLPDPSEVLGLNPTIYEDDVVIGHETYTLFAFPMPEDMDRFMQSYGPLAVKAGYTVAESAMPQLNGLPGPFAYCVSNGARRAYFVPDYRGCLLVMVDQRIEFVHMPTPVPTAPPTPAPTPTPEIVILPDGGGGGGRHLEYRDVQVDCPSCHGGTCSICNGTGIYRNYGASVACNPICTSCGGRGYIIQRQPYWVYD